MELFSELMKKYPFVFVIGILLVVTLLDFTASADTYNLPQADSDSRPNILFIQTDDQDARSIDAKLPNGEYVMKNARELIMKNGIRFNKNYITLPLCCPSRSTTLTGLYAHNHNIYSNDPWTGGGYPNFNDTSTLPIWLQNAGYYTMHAGKYLNYYAGTKIPPGWSRWYTYWVPGLASYYNYDITNETGEKIHFGYGSENYLTDVLTNKALEYLEQKPYGSSQFFLQLNYFAPHSGWPTNKAVPADRHIGMMDNAALPMPPNFNEADVSDKPMLVKNMPLLDNDDISNITDQYRRRMESLLAVDEGIGRIISKLRQTGQYENTIIIFTSDNGWLQGEHRFKMGKSFPYEPLQVPLIVSGPGVKKNVKSDMLVGNADYSPTILELAHATAGLPQDGISFAPLLSNPDGQGISWRNDYLIEISKDDTGLRVQDKDNKREYLYMEYNYDNDTIADERELYAFMPDDCVKRGDPYQLESQHNNTCYIGLIKQFHDRLARLKDCVGDECH